MARAVDQTSSTSRPSRWRDPREPPAERPVSRGPLSWDCCHCSFPALSGSIHCRHADRTCRGRATYAPGGNYVFLGRCRCGLFAVRFCLKREQCVDVASTLWTCGRRLVLGGCRHRRSDQCWCAVCYRRPALAHSVGSATDRSHRHACHPGYSCTRHRVSGSPSTGTSDSS